MEPILRRSSFYYITALCTYMVLMGRFMLTRDWPVFEVIPLFLPVWLLAAQLSSEHDERYAYLRTLPIPDRRVARIKFTLILTAAATAWVLMTAAALYRAADGLTEPSTLVYITCVATFGLLLAGCYQIAIWRYGFPAMFAVSGVSIAVGLVLVIIHLANLKYNTFWPALSRLAVVEWLGGAAWISNVLIAALALTVFYGLLRVGIRVKESSEACL
jgi:hypothetical protein